MTIDINQLNNKSTDHVTTQNNEIATVPHPWRRNLARSLDLFAYSLIWTTFSHLVLRWNPESEFIINIIYGYISCGLMIVIEPLLLSTIGTTLGKWVFGLVIRDTNGRKLTFGRALYRTLGVFIVGMGYNIPIYSIYKEIKCYNACKNKEPMPWEEGFTYRIKDKKVIRAIPYVGITIVIFALTVLILLQAQMPIHRGEITAAQYYENCNDTMSYSRIDYGKHLNEQGKWIDDPFDGTFIVTTNTLPEHVLTLSEGIVRGVKIEIETDKNECISGYSEQKYIAINSFLAAQKEMSPLRFHSSSLLKKFGSDLQNYSFVEAGVRVSNKVEYSGYDLFGDRLIPTEGQKQYFHMIFTLEKVAP